MRLGTLHQGDDRVVVEIRKELDRTPLLGVLGELPNPPAGRRREHTRCDNDRGPTVHPSR